MSLLTKNLSFVGKIGQNIVDDGFKRHVLDIITEKYDARILKKHYIPYDKEYIARVPVVACLRSNGNPYYMCLTRFHGKDVCIFVDKKIQSNYSLPRMVCVFFQMEHSLFQGTIFDGEMVKDCNDKWVFLINDMLALRGQPTSKMKFTERLAGIHGVLNDGFVPCSVDVCAVQVKKYVTVDVLDELVGMELPYTNRGVIFKPLYSKFQDMQMNFDDSVVKRPKEKVATKEDFVCSMREPRKLAIVRGSHIDNYVCQSCEVFVRTMASALKIREMFEGQPVNKSFNVDAVWNDAFGMWELVAVD